MNFEHAQSLLKIAFEGYDGDKVDLIRAMNELLVKSQQPTHTSEQVDDSDLFQDAMECSSDDDEIEECTSSDDEVHGDSSDDEVEDPDEWEVYNVDVFHLDDYYVLPKTVDMDEAKKKCKELGSRVFVTKNYCQYYIRSPPSAKKNRDYNYSKNKAEERVSLKKDDKGYHTYLLNY